MEQNIGADLFVVANEESVRNLQLVAVLVETRRRAAGIEDRIGRLHPYARCSTMRSSRSSPGRCPRLASSSK